MVAKGHDSRTSPWWHHLRRPVPQLPGLPGRRADLSAAGAVAGRAGRGERPGQVILQTYNPEHFSIRRPATRIRAFYDQEIGFRKALGYPPFTRLIQLRISGRDARITREQPKRSGRNAGRGNWRSGVCRIDSILGRSKPPSPASPVIFAGRF